MKKAPPRGVVLSIQFWVLTFSDPGAMIVTKEHRRRLLPLISRNNRLAFWGQAVISFFALFLVDADEQRYKRNDDHSESE